jgi:hypothetical protein
MMVSSEAMVFSPHHRSKNSRPATCDGVRDL